MFDWFHRLFSGQPGPPPEGVEVERDALGRVIRATATLGPRAAAPPGNAPPAVEFSPASGPLFEAASRWLCERNVAAAQGWAVGLHKRFAFDQTDGRLVLSFEQGADLVLPAQVLGSFDPFDGSFMWGWHNPSLRPELQLAARQAREDGERRGEAALTTPLLRLRFDRLAVLLAHAAQVAGADGVHRAITETGSSVFLAYRLADVPARLTPADPAFVAEARARVQRYDADQAALDRAYHEQQEADDGTLLRRTLQAKMLAWRRDWARDDDYWHPCSTSWPSTHDRSRAGLQFCAPHPLGGVLDVAVRDSISRTVYRVEQVDGQARITDQLIDWGNGFLWPGMQSS